MLRSMPVVRLAATAGAAAASGAPLSSAITRCALRARPFALSQTLPLGTSPASQWRSFATARGRPKAGKATATTTRRPRATASTTKKSPASTNRQASGARKTPGRPKKKAAPKGPKKRVQTEQQKAAAAKRKERHDLKELKEHALSATEPKKKPESAYRVFITENTVKGSSAAQQIKELGQKFRALGAAELEVRPSSLSNFRHGLERDWLT